MMTKSTLNELTAYSFDNDLDNQDDSDLMAEFLEYSGDCFISDVISDVADNNISIYNHEILGNACGLYDSYETAREEGLIGNCDLIRSLQISWFYYNDRQLNDNLDALIYNVAISHLNEKGLKMGDEYYLQLKEKLKSICSDNTMNDIIEIVETLLEEEDLPFK